MAKYKQVVTKLTDKEFFEFYGIVKGQGKNVSDVVTDLVKSYTIAWNKPKENEEEMI